MPKEPVEILNIEGELDKSFVVCSPRLVVALVDSSSEVEDEMALNSRKGLKELIPRRNKVHHLRMP